MGATEQQLATLTVIGVDVSSYSNVLLSMGFIVFVFAFLLIYLWETLTNYPNSPIQNQGYSEVESRDTMLDSSAFLDDDDDEGEYGRHDAVELKDTSRRNVA
jgi:hypothetical protein